SGSTWRAHCTLGLALPASSGPGDSPEVRDVMHPSAPLGPLPHRFPAASRRASTSLPRATEKSASMISRDLATAISPHAGVQYCLRSTMRTFTRIQTGICLAASPVTNHRYASVYMDIYTAPA